MTAITVHHRVPGEQLGVGLIRVEGIEVAPASAALERALAAGIARRRRPLTAEEEAVRRAARDMLRTRSYKPTGRGKPASEYLLRAAAEDDFPRINGPVDALNLVSLEALVPISICDLDRAGSAELELRLGDEQESYVFNRTGQQLRLHDLVCGCTVRGERSTPIVTPIKDAMATKLVEQTRRACACIYYPLAAGGLEALERVTGELRRWLQDCGSDVQAAHTIARPGATVSL